MTKAPIAMRILRPERVTSLVMVLAGAASVLLARETRATHVDPTLPKTIVVGAPPGHAPMARVDGGRRGRSHDPLPEEPRVLWRIAPRGALDFAPIAVDSSGSIIAASAGMPDIVQLGPDGAEQWRGRTGLGPSVTGAVILGDGTRTLVNGAGELIGFYPAGRARFAAPLDLPERNAHLSILPLDDGGLAIAAGHDVDELDADGTRQYRAHFTERLSGPLLAAHGGIVATTAGGNVYVVKAGFAKHLGTLGGDPGQGGASSPDGRTIVAVVDHQRVVTFDLASGGVETSYAVADQSLHGPVVFGAGDTRVLVTWNGVLTRFAKNGTNLRRTPLDGRAESLVTDAGKVDFAQLDESPPPLTDEQGHVAFARVGGRIGVVASDGAVRFVGGATCSSPAALSPAGSYRMVVGCRDGTILMIGENSP